MQFANNSRTDPVFRTSTMRVFLFVVVVVAAPLVAVLTQSAAAQPTPEDVKLNDQDRTAVRYLYRVHPILAGDLENALKSGSTEEARREALGEFNRHLRIVIDRGKRLPEPYRQANWDLVARIADYAFQQVWHQEDMLSPEPLQIEDDIIKRVNFRNYEELYDFMRQRSDFGFTYLKDLEIVKRDDPLKYIEELHTLIDELKAYRARKKSGRTVRVKPGDVVATEDRPAGARTTKTVSPADKQSPETPDKDVKPKVQRGDDKDNEMGGTRGPDVITGGPGRDKFSFTNREDEYNTLDDGDRITDYESGETILLEGVLLSGKNINLVYDADSKQTRIELDVPDWTGETDGLPDKVIVLDGDKQGTVQLDVNCCANPTSTISVRLSGE